jgi:hypothetical protein
MTFNKTKQVKDPKWIITHIKIKWMNKCSPLQVSFLIQIKWIQINKIWKAAHSHNSNHQLKIWITWIIWQRVAILNNKINSRWIILEEIMINIAVQHNKIVLAIMVVISIQVNKIVIIVYLATLKMNSSLEEWWTIKIKIWIICKIISWILIVIRNNHHSFSPVNKTRTNRISLVWV